MAGIVRYFQNGLARAVEPNEIADLRSQMKAANELGQVAAVAMAVVAVSLTVFSLMGGGFFGLLGFVVGAALGIIAYDTFVACRNGVSVADQPRFFANIDSNDDQAVMRRLRDQIFPELFKGTIIMRPIMNAVMLHLEQEAQRLAARQA